MIGTILAVIRKELKDSLRDKRSLTGVLAFGIMGPVFIALAISVAADRESSQDAISVIVEPPGVAEDLEAYLEQRNFELVEADAAVRLVVPEDYDRRFSDGESVRVELYVDRSRNKDRRQGDRLERAIQGYAAELGQLRLMLRGVAGSVVQPVTVDVKDLATPESRAGLVLGLLSLYFLLAAFVGSMGVAIDASAGERERNSLEVLMAQPVSPAAVFAGKWLVASLFGLFSVVLIIVFSKIAFLKVPLADIGLTWTLDLRMMALLTLSLVSLALFASAVQMVLAMLAKSYKEASSYLNLLTFVPAVVAMMVVLMEVDTQTWMYAVPVLGHQQMLLTLIRNEPLGVLDIALLTGATIGLALALVAVGGRMLKRERIIFGTG